MGDSTVRIRAIAGCLTILFVATSFAIPIADAAPEGVPVGMNMSSVKPLADAGAAPHYGAYWVGAWMTQFGWGGLDAALADAVANDVTPVIYWYYWGDSISPACVERGCDGRSRAQWSEMTRTLASKLETSLDGRAAYVVLENEFNKGGIAGADYAPTFDAYLSDVSAVLKAKPGVRTVIGYGSWGEDAWNRFPKTLAGSDAVGFQIMRGSTRDSESTYRGAPDKIASVLDFIATEFTKPAFLYDLALSSYPDTRWETIQRDTLQAIADRAPEYRAKGLLGIVYRELYDNPDMSPANYFGYAEQHWGLFEKGGRAKPAWSAWTSLAASSPGGGPPAVPTTNVPGAFEGERMRASTGGREPDTRASGGAVWNLWSNGDLKQTLIADAETSVTLAVTARGSALAGVAPIIEVRVDGALLARAAVPSAFTTLEARTVLSAGAHEVTLTFTNDARSATEDRNLYVDVLAVRVTPILRADFESSVDGLRATFAANASNPSSTRYTWTFGDGRSATGPTATHTYASDGAYTVTLLASADGDDVTAQRTVTVARANAAPVASFAFTGDDLSKTFDARASTDADGDALTFTWNFGDGTSGSGPTVTHAYASAGTFAVTLRVSDGRADSTLMKQIEVTTPNRAPTASFVVTGANLDWNFDATGSTDPDGDALTSTWDFGDGSRGTGERISHTYATTGTFQVTVTVRDARTYATAIRTIQTQSAPGATPPPTAGREAEAFPVKDNGVRFNDAGASAGAGWLLWSDGAIAAPFSPGGGAYRVHVVAKGDHGGGWPMMELRADGVRIATWEVASSKWESYSAPVPFTLGEARTLSVHFTNDAVVNGADRNLRVDVVRVTAENAPVRVTVEAETFRTKDNGVRFTDATASANGAWLLWSNGALRHTVAPGTGTFGVDIVAKGDQAAGAPIMELRVDGALIARWVVDATKWTTYHADVNLGSGGAREFTIHFVNDHYANGADRNLRIDRMTFTQ